MNTDVAVAAQERGVVRVFALSMTDAEAKAMVEDATVIANMLGTELSLDLDHIELFPVTDLEGVGLTGYLEDGAGVPAAQLGPDKAKLDKLGGWVLVVFSGAFGGLETRLNPASSLTLIGTYGAEQTSWISDAPLHAESAAPHTAPETTVKKRPSDAALSGRVAMLVLIGLGLFTYAFIRIAG